MQLAFPFRLDRGRTAVVDEAAHLRDLIEQVLFTSPGERVERPTFGCGVQHLVFSPSGDDTAAAAQVLVQGALQQWLGELATIERVDVASQDATLRVTVQYTDLRSGQRLVSGYQHEV